MGDALPEISNKELTAHLAAGRRALEGIDQIELIEDYVWYQEVNLWALRLRLKPEVLPDGPIPQESDWYVVIEDIYPWGVIIFYPAQERGITQTFPHQNYNGELHPRLPWRKGRLCVDTGLHALGRSGYDAEEPFSVDDRLKWHALRALEWLHEASFGRLTLPGDPFELPDFCSNSSLTIAFNETPIMLLQTWQSISKTKGRANILPLKGASETVIIDRFCSLKDQELVKPSWGSELSSVSENGLNAAWIKLLQVPMLEPYCAPMTWGELRQACHAQGVDIHERIMALAPQFRDGLDHILLLGFPIPKKVGEEPRQMYWLAMKLPALSRGFNQGFENNERGWRQRDLHMVLRDSTKLEWYHTENWSPAELAGRGVLSEIVTKETIAVVGAGAIGSTVSEQLVRAGTYHQIIIDGETLEAGNLVRHTLNMKSLGKNKAIALAERLNLISPHAQIKAIPQALPLKNSDDIKMLLEASVIVDCTGSDSVLEHLAKFEWQTQKVFFSISQGMWAKRLFLFSAAADRFPRDAFISMVNPWLRKEIAENEGSELPRKGIGCWHPLLPARADDVWLMTAVAVKYLEDSLKSLSSEPKLTVFEQVKDSTGFIGLRQVALE